MEVKCNNKGGDISDPESMGIIPRVMSRTFEMIEQASETIEFTIKVSMLEIYNERIQDLLNPLNNNLKIKESKLSGVFVDECTEIYVSSPQEMRDAMLLGSQNRTIASTRMNERSSRSHSIFVMTISQKDTSSGSSKVSRIYFVDLAGSEKIAKTEVKGKQLEEAKNINKSLTALGLVINTLAEGKKGVHIPYRDSKLTRLLQDSLGGNSLTTLLIACSMCSYNDKETLSTLRFGQRAKAIKNKPKENIELSAKELQGLLEASELKVKTLEELIQLQKAECLKRGISLECFQEKFLQNKPAELISLLGEDSADLKSSTKSDELEEFDLLGLTVGGSTIAEEGPKVTNFSKQINLVQQEKFPVSALGDPKEIQDLKKQVAKQKKEIEELNDMIEMIQAEMEDLTIDNVDLKEKNEKLVKGGIRIIGRYHKELVHATMTFEQLAIKTQKKWVMYTQLVSDIEELREALTQISEKIETNSQLGRLALPSELLAGHGSQSLRLSSTKGNILLSELFLLISQELQQSFEKTPLKFSMSEYSMSFDQELMNLATSINRFKNSVLEEVQDSLVTDQKPTNSSKKTQEMTGISDIKQLDLSKFDPADIPSQLKSLLDEAQSSNETLRTRIKELISENNQIKAKNKAEYEYQLIENLENHNKEINLKEQEFEELKRANADMKNEMFQVMNQNKELVEELDGLRKTFNHEIITPRGDRSRVKAADLETQASSSSEQEAGALVKKVARYRKERDRAEQQARELRARLVISEEQLQIESEKNVVLKRTIRELEDELDQLSHLQSGMATSKDHHAVNQVKTLRGGNKQKKELNIQQVNLFTCEDNESIGEEEMDDFYEDMVMQNSIGAFNKTPTK
jgi:kinesin family protein 5